MIEDVYEPLAAYSGEFKDKLSRLAREKFLSLADSSGVDRDANRHLVSVIKSLEKSASSARTKKNASFFFMVLGFITAAVSIFAAASSQKADSGTVGFWLLGFAAGLALGSWLFPVHRRAKARLKDLEADIAAKRSEAWRQMAPLNRLYTWDIPVKLIEATVPRLAFDPYFTDSRLLCLKEGYGWDDSFNDGKSIIFAQSGEINGNPFVFGEYLEMQWGEKTYEGTKDISWTEWETDSNGKRRRVTRHQTLRATVVKPIPEYSDEKILVYGNEAAPDLSFSREPSGLNADDSAFFGNIRKHWRLSRLKAFSRNLSDSSDFTLMNNHEFETWFHAKDRDDEVQFRLLFTPVAQRQMLMLMKDRSVGFGDDFAFAKVRRINILASRHLNDGVLDTDPARFRHWDFDAAFGNFTAFNERYFKDVYFSLAPLLAIPLYQQTRPGGAMAPELHGGSSFWEHEAIANFHGEEAFRHPDSVTRNILKTRVESRDGGACDISVTAHGFRGEKRTDTEEVLGGDGKWHAVAIPWIEYLPVERVRLMHIEENPAPADARARRSILSSLD
ncbi:MAG: hypothetical protein K6F50_00930 [Kiritimatiellae bacterium]|nr:hypothetical protein [Kiritimatiellia bacterium]